eukprot:GHRR01004719.1.p1 GENE.GHRR01004719.1~~GHRR01004719.1.p1  ORF type:complete len:289 (+),score=64.22 GHRR01004719.1:75-941(+)
MAQQQRRQSAKDRRSSDERTPDEDSNINRPDSSGKGQHKVEKVRVWWPPTRDKNRTGFSGAYWPATVLKKGANSLTVEYDNGEREKVDPDNIFPYEVPIDFGKEAQPIEVGEFVEVSNNSKTDPCAWVGVCATVGQKCLIDYPFHDSPSEYIKPHLLRRARVWDDFDWQYIEPGQTWKAGEVTSPLELHLQPELEYFQQLKQFNGRSKVKQESDTDIKQEGSGESEADDQQDSSAQQRKQSVKKRGRPRKPGNPTRSTVDEASNGHDDKKDEKPKGAKRRKPSAVRQA